MAIEILLRRTIDGVGEVGDVVKVRNGFARNYLFPRGWADTVNPESLKRIEKDKELEAVRLAHEAKELASLGELLSRLTLTVEARSGEDGHLYGSVGPRHAAVALAREGFDVQERQIRFEPIRELGEYEIPVSLTRERVVPVKLWVVRDAREAAADAAEAAKRAAAETAAETAAQTAAQTGAQTGAKTTAQTGARTGERPG
jgi:large subunit ribosomal protein L9